MKPLIYIDNKGVESIPLKLIIVVLCLAIIIPSFIIGLTGYSNSQAENDLKGEIDRIESTIKQTYNGDEGTSFSLSVNFQDGITRKIDHVKIGDKIGEHGGNFQSAVRYKFQGEGMRTEVIENPNIMTSSPSNTELELGSGKYKIIAEKHEIAGIGFVIVRLEGDEGEFQICDITLSGKDIEIVNNVDYYTTEDELNPDGSNPELFTGLLINATIHNMGNIDTIDSPWSGDGKVRVRFIDNLIDKGNETRLIGEDVIIDNIPAGGSVTVHPTKPWIFVGPDDDYQDPELLRREVIVIADVLDNVDELSGENNMARKEHVNKLPLVTHVWADIDDDAPGIGTFVVDVFAENTIHAEAEDPDAWVQKVMFIYHPKTYPEDKRDPSHLDTDGNDGFSHTMDMGQLPHTTPITVKALDNVGCGSPPYYERIYMDIMPEWMGGLKSRANQESGDKDLSFDTSNYTFKLIIDVPGDLLSGFNNSFGGGMPFISGKDNAMSNLYQLEIDVPLGIDVEFHKKSNFLSDILSARIGSEVDGETDIWAKIHVGLDKGIEINLTKIFDLIANVKQLVYYWDEYKEILWEVDWQTIKNAPTDVDVLLSALNDAYNKVKDKPEFSELKETIENITEIIDYYRNCYEELQELWTSIMNFYDDPASILKLVSFEAGATITLGKTFEWTLFEASYPIFPPLIEVTVKVTADLTLSFTASAVFEGDLTGLDFASVDAIFTGTAGLELIAQVDIGVNFVIGGGGIRGRITGRPQLTLNAGLTYSTTEGFDPIFDGTFEIILTAWLGAYVEFLFWTKEWTWWEGSYTVGSWDFDLAPGGSTTQNLTPTENNDTGTKPGNVTVPAGPASASDGLGNSTWVDSYDYNQNPDNPNYEIRYSFDNSTWYQLTTNNKIEAEPAVVYNSTGQTFIVWNQWCDNVDLNYTTLDVNDFLDNSDIYYAILNGSTVVKGPTRLYGANTKPDFQPSIDAGSNGQVMVIWTRDDDDNVTTGDDQAQYFSTWNGSAWSVPEVKLDSGSFNYDCKMAYVSDGRILSTWIYDSDEDFFTSGDQQIKYSVFSSGTWSSPEPLTDDDSRKKYTSLSGNGEEFILVWLSKENDYTYKIQSRTWDKDTGIWTPTETVNTSYTLVQSPQVVVTEDGIAILVWRSNYEIVNWSNPDEGWIYYSTKDLKTDSDWTEPRKVSLVRAGLLEFFSSLALIDKDTATYTYRNLTGPLDNPTEVMETVFIELKPDLVISDVLVEDTKTLSATEGVPVQINAMLSNLGDIDAEDVNVSFYDGDPDTGSELIDSIVLTNVPRLWSEIVSINWDVEPGIHDIHVVVDPSNAIVEHEEGNNRGYCTVNCLPDLKIEPENISFSSTTPNEGQEIQITADVHNIGYTSAENVQVNFYDGDPNDGGTSIATEYIVFIGIDQTGQAIVNWAAHGGIHDIYVEVIDVDDMDLTNNIASNSISILPDLSIEVGDFTVSESELLENEEVTLSATVHNIGGANVSYVIVKFYTADEFIGYDIVNVSINGIIDNTATVSFDWTPPVGVHLIYVKVDPGNQIKEMNEANNIQQTMVTVLRSLDLSVDLQLEETEPGKILITANIPNNGNGNASNVNVEFYDGEPGLGGVLINSTNITQIEGHGSTGVSFEWQTTSGRKTVYAVVDGMDIIPETDETNNVQSKGIQVGEEKEEEGSSLLLIVLVIVLIAIPVILIIFWWRRRLIH